MLGIALLCLVTVLYAGYNLFIKLSGQQVPAEATTTILATICIQLAALLTSVVVLGALALRGGQVMVLSTGSYLWAIVAGLCIGGAEIVYLYLFGGVGFVQANGRERGCSHRSQWDGGHRYGVLILGVEGTHNLGTNSGECPDRTRYFVSLYQGWERSPGRSVGACS